MLIQSFPTLCDPMDCSLPVSSDHGILQEYWSGLPFPLDCHSISSRESSQLRDQIHVSCVSCISGGFFTHWTTWEAHYFTISMKNAYGLRNKTKPKIFWVIGLLILSTPSINCLFTNSNPIFIIPIPVLTSELSSKFSSPQFNIFWSVKVCWIP